MYVSEPPALDILVRTSGVERFSDFMLWQAHGFQKDEKSKPLIEFIDILWPEFGTWDMFWVLIKWGYYHRKKQQQLQ